MSKYRLQLNKRFWFSSLYCLLMALVFVRHVFQIDFPTVILLALTVVMVLLGGRNEILAVLICCIPLTTAFLHTYTLLVGILVFAFKYRRDIRIDLTVIPILLMLLWELLHGYGQDFSIVAFVGNFSVFLLLGLLMWQNGRKVDYPFIICSYALTVSIMCLALLGMVLVRSGFDLAAAFVSMQRLGQSEETAGQITLDINPNSLGVMCVLAITGLLQLMTTGRKRTGDLLMLVLMLVCGTLTTSRTYLVLLGIMAVLFWAGQRGSFSQKLRFLLAVLLSVAVAVGILLLVFPDVVQTFIKRFLVEDITSGRDDLFVNYNRFFLSSGRYMFFGVGLNDFGQRIMTQALMDNVPHNGTQELLLAWGIPGLLIFGLFLLSMIWRGRVSAGAHRLLNYIPLILILAKAQAGQMLTSDYTMLAFALAYLSLAYDFSARPGRKPK